MDFVKMFQKGGMGAFTFLLSTVASVIIANPQAIANWIPSHFSQMTVGTIATAVLVMAANWVKNINTPKGGVQA